VHRSHNRQLCEKKGIQALIPPSGKEEAKVIHSEVPATPPSIPFSKGIGNSRSHGEQPFKDDSNPVSGARDTFSLHIRVKVGLRRNLHSQGT